MNNTTINKTIFLNASRDNVWSFLTEKDKLAKWFHPSENDLKEGENYACLRTAEDGNTIPQIWGKVVKMDVPNKLVYTFIIDPFKENETTVTWLLEDIPGGTRLTLMHEGVAEAAQSEALQLLIALDQGWDKHLNGMRESIAS